MFSTTINNNENTVTFRFQIARIKGKSNLVYLTKMMTPYHYYLTVNQNQNGVSLE